MQRTRSGLKMLLLTACLSVALLIGLGGSVFADETRYSAADTTLEKDFKMDTNLTTPAEKFTFTFVPVKVNEDAASSTNMPVQYTKTLTYTSVDPTTTTITGDTKIVYEQLKGTEGATRSETDGKLLPSLGVTEGTQFTHAGVYVYTVTETSTSDSAPDNGTVTSSKAKYTMRVYVDNSTVTGSVNGLIISGVTIQNDLDDNGTAVENTPKVDPTTSETKKQSAFVFTNTFTKSQTLDIQKTVTGNNGDKSREFPFTTTLTLPSTNSATTSYTAEIWKDGAKVTGSTDVIFNSTSSPAYTNTYQLKDGEYLHFSALPVGTTYTVTENLTGNTAFSNYKATATVQYDNKTAIAATGTDATPATGASITVNQTGDGTTAAKTAVGETAANKTIVTNEYQTVTVTGLFIDNLPYILMIAVPLMAFGFYMASKKKKGARS